jgi:hypothetical protein
MQPGIDRRRDGSTKSIYVRCKRSAPGQMAGPARSCPGWPCRRIRPPGGTGQQEHAVSRDRGSRRLASWASWASRGCAVSWRRPDAEVAVGPDGAGPAGVPPRRQADLVGLVTDARAKAGRAGRVMPPGQRRTGPPPRPSSPARTRPDPAGSLCSPASAPVLPVHACSVGCVRVGPSCYLHAAAYA